MKRIEILKEAHELLRERGVISICFAIHIVLINKTTDDTYDKLDRELKCYFPLFTLENAKKFGADDSYGFWWPQNQYGLFSGRRRFMRWLMKKYKNDKEEII